MAIVRSSSGLSLARSSWTHVALPARRAGCSRGCARGPSATDDARCRPCRDRRRARRGGRDRAAAREPARARLSARQLELVVTSDASTDRTEELAEAAGARVIRIPRGGKVAAQDSAVRADRRARSSRSPTRTAPGRPTRCAGLFARSPIPTSPMSAAGCSIQDADGRNKEGVYWRYELAAARRRVAARLGHRRQRLDLRGAPRGLRRGRPALRARPLAAVPDGAARPARGLRARGARVREGDADERDRVPAQGAHVRALLADRARGEDAAPPAAALLASRSSRTGCSATRSGLLHVVLLASLDRAGRRGLGLRRRARRPARPARRCGRRCRHRPLLRARHLGDARRALELPAARRARDVGAGGGTR